MPMSDAQLDQVMTDVGTSFNAVSACKDVADADPGALAVSKALSTAGRALSDAYNTARIFKANRSAVNYQQIAAGTPNKPR